MQRARLAAFTRSEWLEGARIVDQIDRSKRLPKLGGRGLIEVEPA
jgi:hypothetical protein